MSPQLKDWLSLILPLGLSAYAVIVIIKERQRRGEIDSGELRKDVKAFVEEFRSCLKNLELMIKELTIMQKLTTNTLTGLVDKMEILEKRVNAHDTSIALIMRRKGS